MLAAELLYEDLVPYYLQRHSVGQASPARVSLRLPRQHRSGGRCGRAIDYVLGYIEKWPALTDMKIIVETAHREFLSSGT